MNFYPTAVPININRSFVDEGIARFFLNFYSSRRGPRLHCLLAICATKALRLRPQYASSIFLFLMVRKMSKKFSKLFRLSATCVALTGFIVAAGAVLVPSTSANAVVGVRDIDVCEWSDLDWEDMERVEQNAWAVLGWTEERWDKGWSPAASKKDWEDLSAGERGALTDLGYDEEDWDDDDC